jgi:hypothetical protein
MTDEDRPARDSESNRGPASDTDINARVRAILSGILLVGFVLTLVVVVFLQYNAPGLEGIRTTESVGSIYAGVTGAILGYHFGKGT